MDQQSGVCLASRPKILFDAQMNFDSMPAKPTSSEFLTPAWARELHMMDNRFIFLCILISRYIARRTNTADVGLPVFSLVLTPHAFHESEEHHRSAFRTTFGLHLGRRQTQRSIKRPYRGRLVEERVNAAGQES